MSFLTHCFFLFLFFFSCLSIPVAQAAQLLEAAPLDRDYLLVHVTDGEVIHHEGDTGDEVVRYTPELDTTEAVTVTNWTITSTDDSAYTVGQNPTVCYRKKKLSGHAQYDYDSSISDYQYEYTYEHWMYLKLPSSLQEGKSYTLTIGSDTNIDTTTISFTFDVCSSLSEAVHVNIVGYPPDAPQKGADLYAWMGDGGARDYSSFAGNTVYACNVSTGVKTAVGTVAFWKERDKLYGWSFDLTASDVWSADFDQLSTPGTYRLAIEGVGSSQEFAIADDVYQAPFITNLRGYFYMRLGEEDTGEMTPPPRSPAYIPGEGWPVPVVYLTTMQPFDSEWDTFSSNPWDTPTDWASYVKDGSPTNDKATGGHADAYDSDRYMKHIVNIYDMLLPYILTDGIVDDDDCGIPESGNGIPDIIDEARNEVDFWLNLRDGEGYSYGLTNATYSNYQYILYQAGPTALSAWANAANAAMLAEAFRVAGNESLKQNYIDEAVEAFTYAGSLSNPMLDKGISVDDGLLRGRDLKMMAAAYLYNLTGDTSYEDVIYEESVCAEGCGGKNLLYPDRRNQLYGAAAYLTTPQKVHYQTMYNALYEQVISEAKEKEADFSESRPTRRGANEDVTYWQTAQFMDRTILAHAITTDATEKEFFRKAMELEIAWGLGRNPLNLIQMTTYFSPLSDKRSFTDIYTSGRNDGVAGLDPGHTPFVNLQDWSSTMVMGMASALYANAYPENVVSSAWPRAEAYFPSRYVYSANEYTPRQTMRGKMALYTYFWGLGKIHIKETQFPWNIFFPAILHGAN